MRRILVLSVLALCGCNMAMRTTLEGEQNQVVRVESGERLYLEMKENATTGFRWEATSDDPDVEVRLEHVAPDCSNGLCGAPGKVKAEIRIHRGYDGPSVVTFAYRRPWEKKPIKSFAVTLYKRTGAVAFWE